MSNVKSPVPCLFTGGVLGGTEGGRYVWIAGFVFAFIEAVFIFLLNIYAWAFLEIDKSYMDHGTAAKSYSTAENKPSVETVDKTSP